MYFIKRLPVIICSLILIVTLSISACYLIAMLNMCNENYLYPKFNLHQVVWCLIIVGVFLFINIIFLWITLVCTKVKLLKTLRYVGFYTFCFLFAANSIFLSALIGLSGYSYTDEIDNYLVFDDTNEYLEATKEFFPTANDIKAYKNADCRLDYSYHFEYPFLYDAHAYDITLTVFFEDDDAFQTCLKDLYDSYFDVSTEEQIVITLIDGNYKMLGEEATIVQKITVNESEKTVTFKSSAEPWFGDLDD